MQLFLFKKVKMWVEPALFCKISTIFAPKYLLTMAFSQDNFTGRQTTPVTTNLIIINVLMLVADYVLGLKGIDLGRALGLHYFDSDSYHPYQMITYMFMHSGFSHLFCNMFSLYMFGRLLEMVWGAQRFIIYYLVCGVGAAIVQQLAWRFGIIDTWITQIQLQDAGFTYGQLVQEGERLLRQLVTVGASGSVFGILLAFGMMFPNAQLFLLFPPIPLKAKWLVIGYGLFELFAGVAGTTGDNVAHFAHLGGMIFGFLLIMLWRNERRHEF